MCRHTYFVWPIVIVVATLWLGGCSPRINVFPDYSEPLQEASLSGSGNDKILIVPISGVITDRPRQGLFFSRPSVVEETISVLNKARKDDAVKALVLRIDSPGGTVTASDILYRSIKDFKQETGKPVVAMMTGLAASGGYYAAVAADRIVAHPTTITGSIGVIFFLVNVEALFDKIGVEAEAVKSGEHKDMGSPFREMSAKERAIMQSINDQFYNQFIRAIADGRPELDEAAVRPYADGRIFTAQQALAAKLIDRIGYADATLEIARQLAGLGDDARVVIYRRSPTSEDHVYRAAAQSGSMQIKLVDLGLDRFTFAPHTGFYYLWEPGIQN